MPGDLPNAAAWKRLFEVLQVKKRLESEGVFHLTAKQIHQIACREPRLMTKFDSRNQRPRILADLGVTILPISNGEYVLLQGDGYCSVPPPDKVETYDAGRLAGVETIPWREGVHSEPQATDALFMASAIRSFAGDDSLLLTIRGKLRSHRFVFGFRTVARMERIAVDGVQIEIDSGFEGKSIVLLEAKFGVIEDFIVRQLFYPFRHLVSKGVSKKISPALLVYSNKVYSLYEFAFADPDLYQSIHLVRHAHYSLEVAKPLPRLADVLSPRRRRAPQTIPFPQADDISKVIDVTELLVLGRLDKAQIAETFDVDPRQGDYYANAAAWVGLVQKLGGLFELTRDGREFVRMNRTDRIVWLARRVSEMPVFHEAAAALIGQAPLDSEEISRLIAKMPRLGGTTPGRRASTVRAWISWLATHLAT